MHYNQLGDASIWEQSMKWKRFIKSKPESKSHVLLQLLFGLALYLDLIKILLQRVLLKIKELDRFFIY